MDKNLINKIKNKKIDYIVEWWEDDSLDIDSNQHILFSLENEDIDIIVTEKNIDEINFILEKFNVNISMEFHVNFLIVLSIQYLDMEKNIMNINMDVC